MKLSQKGKGTYVGVRFDDETKNKVKEIQTQLNLFEPTPIDKLHSTICFSRVPVPYKPLSEACKIGSTTKFKVFKTATGKRALVLLIDSDYLRDRHEYANVLGATYDFPDYQPHITLAYDIGARKIPDSIEPFEVGITHEYVEDLDLEWTPKK